MKLHWLTRFALWITGDDLDVALDRNDGSPGILTEAKFKRLQKRGDAAINSLKRQMDAYNRRSASKDDPNV